MTMGNGYSQSPKLLKGALIEIGENFLGPVPNVIVFQYNPHTLTRSIKPWMPPGEKSVKSPSTDNAQPFDPTETFNLALELDAADALEEPEMHPTAVLHGIADRVAALEMLLYPPNSEGPVGKLLSSIGGGGKAERKAVPIVLFVWGPGRILPVRLTSFSVEEQFFSPTLYPLRATVTIGLYVLDENYFESRKKADGLTTAESLALAAYKYTRGQKEILARANLANSTESILGLLPF